MKEKRNKQWREYDEEGYAALAKYLLTYFQSYFPYCCGWMPSFYDTEIPASPNLPKETKERSPKTK